MESKPPDKSVNAPPNPKYSSGVKSLLPTWYRKLSPQEHAVTSSRLTLEESYGRVWTQFFGVGSLSAGDFLVMISSELRMREPLLSSEPRVLWHRSTKMPRPPTATTLGSILTMHVF